MPDLPKRLAALREKGGLKISFRFEKNLTVSSADKKIGRGFTRITECIGIGRTFAPTAWASAARRDVFVQVRSA